MNVSRDVARLVDTHLCGGTGYGVRVRFPQIRTTINVDPSVEADLELFSERSDGRISSVTPALSPHVKKHLCAVKGLCLPRSSAVESLKRFDPSLGFRESKVKTT